MDFQGRLIKITYYNQDNGYGVVRVEVDEKTIKMFMKEVEDCNFFSNQITVVSTFASLPFVDQMYDFSGEFEYSKYGLQFKSDKTIKSISQSKEGVVSYLSSSMFKGVGEKTAIKIFEILGKDALKKIYEDDTLLAHIGISKKQSDVINNTLKEYYKEEESLVELLSFGLTLNLATRIIKELKTDALRVVKENPYKLIDLVEGIAFIRADDIAMKVGIKKDSPYRIKALILYILRETIRDNGDTYIPVNNLYQACIDIANKDSEVINKDNYETYLNELVKEHKVLIDEEKNVYDVVLSYQENEIARSVYNHIKAEHEVPYSLARLTRTLDEMERVHNINYSDKQREAILNALMEPFFIITGGPGTGKSTIIKAIIELYTAMFDSEKQDVINSQIMLVAPTGRAAKRLREITHHNASTIHKLLGYTGRDFEITDIDAKMIIIDEFSMVDISLAYHLFKAIRPYTKVIIVGDSDQLPAVGAGDILNDLILSKEISMVKLDKIHRQAQTSSIVSLAHTINEGRLPYDIYEKMKDRKFINCDDDNIIPFTIKTIDLYLNQLTLKNHENDSNDEDDYTIDDLGIEKAALVNDIQVLVPLYRTALGIDAFNYYLQDHFNPLTKENYKQIIHQNKKYRKWDKVIQLVNRSEKKVMNGDIGYISEIDGTDGEYEGLTVRYSFGDVHYDLDELDDISLAYAISIHKAQGSEFKLVILPYSFKYYVMLKKKLIYTAVTRAKSYLIMIGNVEAMRKGIVSVEEKRHTKLGDRLKELLKNPDKIFDANSAFDEIKLEDSDLSEKAMTPYDFMDE